MINKDIHVTLNLGIKLDISNKKQFFTDLLKICNRHAVKSGSYWI